MGKFANLRFFITIAAITVAAIHLVFPTISVDAVTAVLLVIAVLPWLQPLIKSVEVLGVKLELQEIKEQIATAKGAAESATQKAAFALSASERSVVAPGALQADNLSAHDALFALADDYDRIRKTQSSGDTRTAAMTTVVRKMIDLAPSIDDFDLLSALKDSRGGMRLAGYAFLYARPIPQHLEPLVNSVSSIEDKPFGQYWGIQTLGKVVSVTKDIPASIRVKLQQLAAHMPQGTDRDYEIRKILASLGRDRG